MVIFVIGVQPIRILQWVVQQLQRVCVTQGILEKVVVLARYARPGNTEVHFGMHLTQIHLTQHFVSRVFEAKILQ